jgi:hemolysin activation/secretion protein
LIGKAITKEEVEAALLTLTDYPGLSVFGVFQPGQHVGQADIVLKVQEENRFDVAFRLDNHGIQETGRARFRPTIEWNSPTGAADKVIFTAQQTYNPKNSTFYAFDYERFLGYGFKGGGFWNGNGFNVGGEFAASRIHAETENIGVFLEKSFIRSRLLNFSSTLTLTHKRSDTTTQKVQTNKDMLTVAGLEFYYDSVDGFNPVQPMNPEDPDYNFGGGINFATLQAFYGFNDFLGSMGSAGSAAGKATGFNPSRRGGSGKFAEGRFTKVNGSYTRLQLLTKHQSMLLRTEFQWARDMLTPLEQYSIGGPENVRAFPEAQALYDRAWFVSFEYLHNAPFMADQPAFANRTWGELLQFSMFYDVAVGRNNDRLPQSEQSPRGWQNYSGVGVGLRFNLPGTLDSRLLFATEVGGQTVDNNRTTQFWGDVTYHF